MTLQPLRALVVDDEPLARRGLRLRLEKRSDVVVVGEAGNGQAALDLLDREQPDLLFLDVQMPGLDGFQTLARIPADSMPLTIFVTAYDQYAVQAFEARAIDYLLKPVEEERLDEALKRVQGQQQGRQALHLVVREVEAPVVPSRPQKRRELGTAFRKNVDRIDPLERRIGKGGPTRFEQFALPVLADLLVDPQPGEKIPCRLER